MKRFIISIIEIFFAFMASAQGWKTVDLSNEWVAESSGQNAFAITTYDGNHLFVYPDRNMVVISPRSGKVASAKYEPVSTTVIIRYYDGRGMQLRRKKMKMLFSSNCAFGIINSEELTRYLQDSDGFVRITHAGRHGFKVETPTFRATEY